MMANVNGYKFFLSAEEIARIKAKVEEDLIARLGHVQEYIEKMHAEREENKGSAYRGTLEGFDTIVTSLLEDLDSYYQVFQGYVKPEALRNGFERNDMGHRIS